MSFRTKLSLVGLEGSVGLFHLLLTPFLLTHCPISPRLSFDSKCSLCIPSLAPGPMQPLSSCFRSHIKCHLLRETSPSHPKSVPLSHRHTCVCTRTHRHTHTHMLALFSIKNLFLIKLIRPFIMACLFVWRRKWQPTPVFLPGRSHGQRSLAGCRPWGCRVGHDSATKPPPPPSCIC